MNIAARVQHVSSETCTKSYKETRGLICSVLSSSQEHDNAACIYSCAIALVPPMEGIDLLAIQPGQLEYVFAPNIELKATLSLKSLLSDGRGVAFKIKTSAVNRLRLTPCQHPLITWRLCLDSGMRTPSCV